MSASAGVSTARAGGAALTAVDVRAGLLVGKTFWDRLTIFAMARAFGGPVFWTVEGESFVGGDAHHYLVGAGLVVRPGRGFELFAEGAPLGERGFSAGASLAF